jgi:hypothetical protein
LKVACAKMTVNRKKMQIESATTAGVRLRFFLSRVDGVADDILGEEKPGPAAWQGEHVRERAPIICGFPAESEHE